MSSISISAEDLLAVTRRYWRPDRDYEQGLEDSPETERLKALWEQELKKMDQWRALLSELKVALPDFSIGNATATCDPCFRCSVYSKVENEPRPHRWVVVGCVSILAPVYAIYGVRFDYKGRERADEKVLFEPLPPEMQAPAEVVARKIEAMFGAQALPREIAETRVPLIVERKEPPETTLFHALFTSVPESVP